MLNFNFIKLQFKNIWIPLLVFGIIFGVLIIVLGISFPTLGESVQTTFNSHTIGAASVLNLTLFGFPSFVLFFALATILSSQLLNKDINRGYIASWLTTPMSRRTIFNSKLFAIIGAIFLINIWIIFLELLVFGIGMRDFTAVIGTLLFANLSLIIFSTLLGAINWIVFALVKKSGWAIGICLALAAWFSLCALLQTMQYSSGMGDLKYFKYFTILSLFNSPLSFEELIWREWIPGSPIDSATIIPGTAKILSIEAKDFAWQLPVTFVVATGLFTGGQFAIKDKDFAF